MDILGTDAQAWQRELIAGRLNSLGLVDICYEQIEKHNRQGMHLNALINLMPKATAHKQAQQLDRERAASHVRGPMHGIPVIIKDIIPTSKEHGMPTTCGAYALRAATGKSDCLLVERLVAAGLIVIGKSNLNEYCRMRDVPSGWSMLGGQTQSPYVAGGLKPGETPIGNTTISGSSSGSAAGVAAGFAPLSIGTETIGSLVFPANRAGLYSLKVTNDQAPKQGILCLSQELDSLGAMAKSAGDIRFMTEIILDRKFDTESEIASPSALRIGHLKASEWRWPNSWCPLSDETRALLDEQYDQAMMALQSSGIKQVSRVSMDSEAIIFKGQNIVDLAVDHEFKSNFAEFLQGLDGHEMRGLEDLVKFNEASGDVALPSPFEGQKDLVRVNELVVDVQCAQRAVAHGRTLAQERLEQAMVDIDLLLAPGDCQLFSFAALAGWPIASLPWTTVEYEKGSRRPEGLTMLGRPNSEDVMTAFMLHYEQIFPERPLPICI